MNRLTTTCDHCGQTFPKWRNGGKHTGPFCSRECYEEWRSAPEQFFWGKLDRQPGDGCWNWMRSTSAAGYGFAAYEGKSVMAHRLAYRLTYGEIPNGLCVLHRCDNPRCCRPDHLFLGTQLDNMRDRAAKGHYSKGDNHWQHQHPERTARGERCNLSRLQAVEVRAIRERYAAGGITQAQLADEYGVRQGTISFIVAGTTWKHIL